MTQAKNFVRTFGVDVQTRKDWVYRFVIRDGKISVFTDVSKTGRSADLSITVSERLPPDFGGFQADISTVYRGNIWNICILEGDGNCILHLLEFAWIILLHSRLWSPISPGLTM